MHAAKDCITADACLSYEEEPVCLSAGHAGSQHQPSDIHENIFVYFH